jgi:hypothetical protein
LERPISRSSRQALRALFDDLGSDWCSFHALGRTQHDAHPRKVVPRRGWTCTVCSPGLNVLDQRLRGEPAAVTLADPMTLEE